MPSHKKHHHHKRGSSLSESNEGEEHSQQAAAFLDAQEEANHNSEDFHHTEDLHFGKEDSVHASHDAGKEGAHANDDEGIDQGGVAHTNEGEGNDHGGIAHANEDEGNDHGHVQAAAFVDAQEEANHNSEDFHHTEDLHFGKEDSVHASHDAGKEGAHANDDEGIDHGGVAHTNEGEGNDHGGIAHANEDEGNDHGHVNEYGEHHLHHVLSTKEKILRLKQLNDTLVKEVSSSRLVKATLDAKVKALEQQVQENVVRADALAMEKNWLEDEKLKFELELAASKEEATNLGLDKVALEKEKEDLVLQKEDLQAALHDVEAKRKGAENRLLEVQRALTMEEENADTLRCEAEHLREEEEKLVETMKALQASKDETQSALNDLEGKKLALEERLGQYKESLFLAENQIEDANKVIKSLQDELSSRELEREGFQMQLREAWQQIATLEAQREDGVARERVLESHLKSLQDELAHAQMKHESITAAVKQAREDKGSLECQLEVVSCRSRELELHLDSMKVSMLGLETKYSNDQERLVSLNDELLALTGEKKMLEEMKAALEKELTELNNGSAMASSQAKQEIQRLQRTKRLLEKSLADAREKHEKNVNQLESNIRELDFLVKKREKLTKMALPLAMVSSASLVVVGLSIIMRRARQR